VGVDDSRAVSTREGLEQGYVVVPADKRLLLLFTFLKKNLNKKVMVFFSSCNSVKYHRWGEGVVDEKRCMAPAE
jgi:ATP-dependent RNA helicase DDX18/HAS1